MEVVRESPGGINPGITSPIGVDETRTYKIMEMYSVRVRKRRGQRTNISWMYSGLTFKSPPLHSPHPQLSHSVDERNVSQKCMVKVTV